MYLKKELYKFFVVFCLLGLFGNMVTALGAEATTDEVLVQAPEPTLPASYYEPIQTDAITDWPQGPVVYAEAAIVMDADTGTILYGKNIEAQKYPASITKIMTTLLAIEHSDPSERVIFSDHAIWGIERNSSHIGIRIGENLSMKDCLYGMMLASANEVCLAVAEHIAGDVDTFVAMMNQKAIELGCTNTNFTNPNGLPDENHYVSAHDMALISRAAFQNDLFREVSSSKTYRIGWTNLTGEDRWLGNHHKMLWDDSPNYYEGCLGGKTGFTQAALNTLVTYANRDGRNLICVLLRTNGSQQTYQDTAALLNYGFQNFHNVAVPDNKKVNYGAYLLPFPATLLDCYSTATRLDLIRNTLASLPNYASSEHLAVHTTLEDTLIKRDLIYNDYLVGEDNIRKPEGIVNRHFLPSTGYPNRSIVTSTATNSTIIETAATKHSPIAAFNELPSWKYPLLGFLVMLLIIIGIKIAFFAKRVKKKKKRAH